VEEAVRLAGGTNRMVSKAQDLPIELGKQKKTITLLTQDEINGNLHLGIDFLSQFNATLQCIITKIGVKKTPQQRKRSTMRRGEGSTATGITEEGVQEAVRMDLDLMNKINGDSHITKNRTFMKHVRPIKQQYYPRNPTMQAIIN